MRSPITIRHSDPPAPERGWWEQPWLLLALVLASARPLLVPDIPPLADLPGHMGRYRVQLEIGGSPQLQRFHGFEWALIGNLGVDLLVVPLAALIGLEPAVKLIAILIPVTTAAALLWIAREVHGRVPPTAFSRCRWLTASPSSSASSTMRWPWRWPCSPSRCGCAWGASAG